MCVCSFLVLFILQVWTTDNHMYPSLYHREYFHCPEHPLGSADLSLPPQQHLATTDLVIVFIVLLFAKCHIVRMIHTACSLLRLISFT